MKKSILSIISNVTLIYVVFVLAFSIFSASTIKYPKNLLFGFLCSVPILFFLILIAKKRFSKLKISYKKQQQIDLVCQYLCFISKSKGLNLFYEQIIKFDNGAKLDKNKIVLSSGVNVFNMFSFSPLSKIDLVRCFNLSKTKKCIILCENASSEVKNFSLCFNNKLVIADKNQIFNKLSPFDFNVGENYLPISLNKKPKPKFNVYLKKKNAKKFLAFGLFFSFMSFFVPIKFYYLIIGTLMLTFSIILMFFGKKEVLT